MIVRSLLFAPANRLDLVAKFPASRADCVVVDLEDGTPAGERPSARQTLKKAVESAAGRAPVYIRVNEIASGDHADDMAAVLGTAAAGVVVPKIADAAAVATVLKTLGAGRTIIAGIESISGVLNADAIAAASPAIAALYFGAEDFGAEMGARRTLEGTEVLYARSRVVLAARAARVPAVDQAVIQIRDDAQFRRDAEMGRNLGYEGKICLNPKQTALANEVFAPSAAEVERARRLIAVYEAAQKKGQGAIDFEGQMVDGPLLKNAQAIVAAAERGGA
jgi:citrate lyase subunit beta/citryl-CoA lyase